MNIGKYHREKMATLRRQSKLNKGSLITDFLIIVQDDTVNYWGLQCFGTWVFLGDTIPENVAPNPIYCYQNGSVIDYENGDPKNIKLNFVRSDLNGFQCD